MLAKEVPKARKSVCGAFEGTRNFERGEGIREVEAGPQHLAGHTALGVVGGVFDIGQPPHGGERIF